MTLPIVLARELQQAFGSAVACASRLDGGCIHEVRRIHFLNGSMCCLKFQEAREDDYLSAELAGLQRLVPHIRVPHPLRWGECEGYRWLALEWLDMRPHGEASLEALAGSLAGLHVQTQPLHGWTSPGFLGRTPLDNTPCVSWTEFFLTRRIEPMLARLHDCGIRMPSAQILRAVENRLAGHHPRPSLVHGDLWTGNTARLEDGRPVVYDPSAYYGDAETDLAMLELFGGPLPGTFLERYHTIRSLAPGRRERTAAYDLLHALNHLLLFGEGYRRMVEHCLRRLL